MCWQPVYSLARAWRARKARPTGKALAALGYVVVSASAHLGGNLSCDEHGIGLSAAHDEERVVEVATQRPVRPTNRRRHLKGMAASGSRRSQALLGNVDGEHSRLGECFQKWP